MAGAITPPPDQLAASVYNWAPGGLAQKSGKEPAKHIAKLKGHSGCIMTLAFTANRDVLASGGVDGTVRLWDFTGSKPSEKASMHKHLDAVHSVAFSPDNKLLASGSGGMDGIVWVFNVSGPQPKEQSVLQGHQGPVDALAFSPDSKLVASGGNDMTVRLWEVDRQSKPKAVLKGHIRAIKDVTFSPDGQTLASAAQDYTVRLWAIGRMWSKEKAVLAHEARGVFRGLCPRRQACGYCFAGPVGPTLGPDDAQTDRENNAERPQRQRSRRDRFAGR